MNPQYTLDQIHTINNQNLYEDFLQNRIAGKAPGTPEYKKAWNDFVFAFLFLNEYYIVRSMYKHNMFETRGSTTSGPKRLKRDNPPKSNTTDHDYSRGIKSIPKWSIKEAVSVDEIYRLSKEGEVSDYANKTFLPEEHNNILVPVLEKCVEDYNPAFYDTDDPGCVDGRVPFIGFFRNRFNIELKKAYLRNRYYDEIQSASWIVEDEDEIFDKTRQKRASTVIRELSRLKKREKEYEISDNLRGEALRERLRKSIRNYSEEQKDFLVDIVLPYDDALAQKIKREKKRKPSDGDYAEKQVNEDHSLNIVRSSRVMEREEVTCDPALIRAFVDGYLENEQISEEDEYILSHYYETDRSDSLNPLLKNRYELWKCFYKHIYGSEPDKSVASPDKIACDLKEMGYEDWTADGVILRYRRLFDELNYRFSQRS